MNKRLRKKYGLSKITKEELWNLDYTLAKYILPRLIRFKEYNKMSYPMDFKNIQEWHDTIDKMIYSFEYIIKDKGFNKESQEKYVEGMNLFAEYFSNLWD